MRKRVPKPDDIGYGHRDSRYAGARPQLAVRFEEAAFDWVYVQAAERGVSCAQVIRDAVDAARGQA